MSNLTTPPPTPTTLLDGPVDDGGQVALTQRSSGAVVSRTTNAASGAVVATESNSLPSVDAPTWVIGSLPPNLSEYPFRSRAWSFTLDDLSRVWSLDMLALDGIKTARKAFGFVYWKELYIEFWHPAGGDAHWVSTTAIGGWTFKRETAITANVAATMPTASSYQFLPGNAVRIGCPFGGLISPLVSHAPLIGSHAIFAADFGGGVNHPYMPVSDANGVSTLKQPEIDKKTKVLYARLHGALVCGAPTPSLFGIS